ncbi:MAG: hypothetical protein ACR2NZ_21760 [Rubripirellula sp.]
MLYMKLRLLGETHMAEVSQQYRETVASSATSGFWYLLIPVFAIAAAVVIYKIAERPPPVVNTPNGMLHELCKAHDIKSGARNLLDRIADEAELEHPATLLLGPEHFEAAVKKAASKTRFDRRQQATLGMLRRRLFA